MTSISEVKSDAWLEISNTDFSSACKNREKYQTLHVKKIYFSIVITEGIVYHQF